VKEKRYNDKIEQRNSQKFDVMKHQVVGYVPSAEQRPSKPVITYLTEVLAANEEEEKKTTAVENVKEPEEVVKTEDDEEKRNFEAIFASFTRKGQGGDIADDSGGGDEGAARDSAKGSGWTDSVFAQLKSKAQGSRAEFNNEIRSKKAKPRKKVKGDPTSVGFEVAWKD